MFYGCDKIGIIGIEFECFGVFEKDCVNCFEGVGVGIWNCVELDCFFFIGIGDV